MLSNMYPFWAAIIANVSAQLIKPFWHYFKTREWKLHLITDSGGLPSSHTATFTALSLAVGIQDNFNSTIFAVTLMISFVIAYDAANVRYYAGQNIQLTQQLIKDIQELMELKFDDPIYAKKVKEVLGHRWIEVIVGGFWGLFVALVLAYLR